MVDKLLTIHEVAEILQVSKAFAYRLVRQGDIPSVRLGRLVRVRQEDVGAYILKRLRQTNLTLQNSEICNSGYVQQRPNHYITKVRVSQPEGPIEPNIIAVNVSKPEEPIEPEIVTVNVYENDLNNKEERGESK
jgi:excisionase family DNA binding protein